MSLWSTVNRGLDIARVCTTAIEVIGGLVKKRGAIKSLEDALNQLDLVGTIVERVRDVVSGKEDPAKARAEFEEMKADLAKNNADVDDAIDDMFDKS